MTKNKVSRRAHSRRPVKWGLWGLAGVLLGSLLAGAGCARLPYTRQVVHEDQRVLIAIQQEVTPVNYTHPVSLSVPELKRLLKGFSIREKKKLPLRWFAEETPPRPLFRIDELDALAPHLSVALEKVGPTERVSFQLRAPGFNPADARDTTAGWIAVHGPYWRLTIDAYHLQFPVRRSDQYDYSLPNVAPEPREYLLTFEPGRFWVEEAGTGERGLDYQSFLKSAESFGAP